MSGLPGITMAANGNSAPCPVSPPQNILWQAPPAYSLGLIITLSPGASLTYSVQVTADQVPTEDGYWNDHEILSGQTISQNSNIAFPVTGIRVVVSNYVSGTVHLGIAQWP